MTGIAENELKTKGISVL